VQVLPPFCFCVILSAAKDLARQRAVVWVAVKRTTLTAETKSPTSKGVYASPRNSFILPTSITKVPLSGTIVQSWPAARAQPGSKSKITASIVNLPSILFPTWKLETPIASARWRRSLIAETFAGVRVSAYCYDRIEAQRPRTVRVSFS